MATRLKKQSKRIRQSLPQNGYFKYSSQKPVKSVTVAELRSTLQLKQSEFAPLFPMSLRSLATLESGTSPSDAVSRRLKELQRLTQALKEVIQVKSLGNWLQTPNEAFDGLKPLEVIDRGESDRIWSMIYFLRSGVPA